MANDLVVNAKLKDEITGKLNTIRGSVSDFSKSVKQTVLPFTQLHQAMQKIALPIAMASGVFVVMKKAATDVTSQLKTLDEISIKTGMSVDELSRRVNGFNIATNNVREADNVWTNMGNAIRTAWTGAGKAINEAVGGMSMAVRTANIRQELITFETKRLGRNLTWDENERITKHAGWMARVQSGAETVKNREKDPQSLQFEADVAQKAQQLSLSTMEYKKKMFDQEIELYRQKGVSEKTLDQYQAAYKQSNDRDRLIAYEKLQAQILEANGHTKDALAMQDEAALLEFKKIWGEDSEMVKAFKQGQEAIKRQRNEWFQVAKGIGNDLSSALGDTMVDGLTNKFKSAGQIFANFGNQMLSAIFGQFAKMAVSSTLGSMFPAFNLLGFHTGGTVPKAHSGAYVNAPASREFPILVRGGETIRTESQEANVQRGMKGGGGVNITVAPVITLMSASDIKRHEKEILGVFENAVASNGTIREIIRRYT